MYNLPKKTKIKARIFGLTTEGNIVDVHTNGYYIMRLKDGSELFVHPKQIITKEIENESN